MKLKLASIALGAVMAAVPPAPSIPVAVGVLQH